MSRVPYAVALALREAATGVREFQARSRTMLNGGQAMTASRITSRLYVGDIGDVREGDTSTFDRVITVCQDNVSDNVSSGVAYDHIALADGPHTGGIYGGSHDYETFAEAAATVLGALTHDEKTLVHCHAGQSRAVTTSAAALAVHEGWHVDDALQKVWEGRGRTHPEQLLIAHMERFAENGGR